LGWAEWLQRSSSRRFGGRDLFRAVGASMGGRPLPTRSRRRCAPRHRSACRGSSPVVGPRCRTTWMGSIGACRISTLLSPSCCSSPVMIATQFASSPARSPVLRPLGGVLFRSTSWMRRYRTRQRPSAVPTGRDARPRTLLGMTIANPGSEASLVFPHVLHGTAQQRKFFDHMFLTCAA
jgi:hypothetical protein